MSPIEYQTAKILAVIRDKQPYDYQDVLDVPRIKGARYEDLMTYLGMYLQGILVINDSFDNVTASTMLAYEACCKTIRKEALAFARPIPQPVRTRFQLYLRTNLPVSWIGSFMREYRLHLFGNIMWVDEKKREYISDFNDPRFLHKTKGIWNLDYKPLKEYHRYEEIKARLEEA